MLVLEIRNRSGGNIDTSLLRKSLVSMFSGRGDMFWNYPVNLRMFVWVRVILVKVETEIVGIYIAQCSVVTAKELPPLALACMSKLLLPLDYGE